MDLTTQWLGLRLAHPIVPSASPLTRTVDGMRRLEDAGAPAVVMHSLFEEQITHESRLLDHYLTFGADSYGEALSYLPDLAAYDLGPESYLEQIWRAKTSLGIPVIASLNGASIGGWIRCAGEMEEAGADAIELNVYFIPTDPSVPGERVEAAYVELVREVKRRVQIPVAVKVGHFFSSIPHAMAQLDDQGVDGLVLFNRFYQPDLDLERLEILPSLDLSHSSELRLRLHWAAILHDRLRADLALTGGVHTGEDVVKAMMVGASAAMTASALLRHGVEQLPVMVDELRAWMERNEYETVEQMQGSMSYRKVADPSALERGNYMKVLNAPPALRND